MPILSKNHFLPGFPEWNEIRSDKLNLMVDSDMLLLNTIKTCTNLTLVIKSDVFIILFLKK